VWSPCYYSVDTFHGVIGINDKDLNARIVVAYVLEHFSVFKLAIAALLILLSQVTGFGPNFPQNNRVKKTNYIEEVCTLYVSLTFYACILINDVITFIVVIECRSCKLVWNRFG